MSILIEGVDMPPTVNGVKLTHELYIRSDGVVFDDDLEEVGQAIQIDRPHGRLIDADELKEAIRTDIMGGLNYERFMNNAPTIIEAEEE